MNIPDEALTSDIAILGKKGRGKSYAAKGIVERLLDLGERILVLDPLGHWYGLKTSGDGREPGYAIATLGGEHADIEIDDQAGRPLARALVEEPMSAVVDMGSMRKAEQQRLVAELLDELFACNRDPLTIVLEEADAFAPQSPMGDAIRVLSEVDRIARRGRAFGFRLLSITQRPAKLHKDVLTQLSVLIALGVTSPQDRDAIRAWVEGNGDRDKAKEVYDTLPMLPRGEGWVWAPDFEILERVTFPKIKTLDTSSTPEQGGRKIKAERLAEVDLSRLRSLLTASSRSLTAATTPQADLTAAEKRGFERGRLLGEKEGRDAAFKELVLTIDRAQSVLSGTIGDLAALTQTLNLGPTVPSATRAEASSPPPHSSKPDRAERASTASNKLSVGAEAFLGTAGKVAPISLTWTQLGTLCRRKAHGGSFNTAKRELIQGRYVEEVRGLVRVTALAFEQLGKPQTSAASMSRATLLQEIVNALPAPSNDIFACIVASDKPLPQEQIAARLNRQPRGGSWNTAMAILRNNALIAETPNGLVVAGIDSFRDA